MDKCYVKVRFCWVSKLVHFGGGYLGIDYFLKSFIFWCLLIDTEAAVQRVGFAWSGGWVHFRFLEVGRFIA